MNKAKTSREQSLAIAVSANYGLSELPQCKLIRAGFNHHYLIESVGQRYVLRVYLNGKYYIHDADDFRFELDLLHYLAGRDVPVARPIANNQGKWLTLVESPEESNYVVLFEFAEGRIFDGSGLKDSDIRRVGVLAAQLHQAADSFASKYYRYHLNLEYLLEKPLRTLEAYLAVRKLGDLGFFKPVAEELRQRIEQLPRTPSEYGIIHGDLIGSNLHLDQKGDFTLIDFDHFDPTSNLNAGVLDTLTISPSPS